PTGPQDVMATILNLWLRWVGTFLACFLLLGVAVRAAGSVSGERDRQTLDGLLITPLSNRSILFAKWLGSVLGGRGSWAGLGGMMGVGLLTEALHPLAVPCFLLAWLVFAAFLAGLGSWFSVANRKTYRATFLTLLTAGSLLLIAYLAVYDLHSELWLNDTEARSLIPPMTLALLAFSPADYNDWLTGKVH